MLGGLGSEGWFGGRRAMERWIEVVSMMGEGMWFYIFSVIVGSIYQRGDRRSALDAPMSSQVR
tara:strand:+ start:6853 stop:7041 length:189 start_codon:yes stop_codon:yes gene_type:complete